MFLVRLGHAGIIVSGAGATCVMDPILEDPFEAGALKCYPAVNVNVRELAAVTNVVIISHAHMDHFSPRSLSVFDRSVTTIYPSGATMIESTLIALGFTKRIPATPGHEIRVGNMALIPSASRAPFPEMGMVFDDGRRTIWNSVDSVLDGKIVRQTQNRIGRQVDLFIAKYQPLIEVDLYMNALGRDFPLARYSRLLRTAAKVFPRYVTPGSCGYVHRVAWLNGRAFPVNEEQFLTDLAKIAPEIQGIIIPPGAGVEIGRTVRRQGNQLPFVKSARRQRGRSTLWQPHRGAAPLIDCNERNYGDEMLKREVGGYLDHVFLKELLKIDAKWIGRMSRYSVVWGLEVVFPDGSLESRVLDFARRPWKWEGDDGKRFLKVHTLVTASAVVGLLRGETNLYAVAFNQYRVMHRLFGANRRGVHLIGGVDDEPLGKVLFSGADERFVEREVRALLEMPLM